MNIKKIIDGISFCVILVISLFLNCILGLSGFKNTYTDALMSRYSIQGESIKNQIESSLQLGKKLYLLESQVGDLFSAALRKSSGIEHFYISDKNEKILFSTRAVLNQDEIPFRYYSAVAGETFSAPKVDGPMFYKYQFLDSWFVCIPLFEEESFQGTLYIEVSEKTIASATASWNVLGLKIILIISSVSILLYLLFIFLLDSKSSKLIDVLTITILLISQLIYSVINYNLYNKAITDVFNTNISVLSDSIHESFKKPMGITKNYESLTGINDYLETHLEANDYCAGAYILSDDGEILYSTGKELGISSLEYLRDNDSEYTVSDLSFSDKKDAKKSFLVLRINRQLINGILKDMAVNFGVIIIVALIFAFIIKDIFILVSQKRDLYVPPAAMNSSQTQVALKLIKISTFIFMFAAYETLSFVPILIENIYNTSYDPSSFLAGMSKDTVISLPVSAYMLGIMVSMCITLFVIKKLPIKNRYVIMSLIFIVGNTITAYSQTIFLMILARFISGFGFGGILLSTSSLVIQYTSDKSRSAGFGTNASGLAAASIASIPVGGVIANQFGYQIGVLISVFFAAIFLLFSVTCMPSDSDLKKNDVENDSTKPITMRDFIRVLFSNHVIVYLLCVNIPFQLIYWGLFNFILPIYMSDTMKISQNNIGVILSIFSVVSLFAGIVASMIDKLKNDKLMIAVGAICAGIALALFGKVSNGFVMFLAVMVAMGIDNLFIDTVEEVYLEAGKVKNVSEENILQSYKVIEKIVSVFIPTVTGAIIASLGFRMSLFSIGVYTLIGAVMFIFLGKNNRWIKPKKGGKK